MLTTKTNTMKNLTERLRVDNLSLLSNGWDKRTKTVFIFIDGYGNESLNSSRFLICTLHGENSISPTGSISVDGVGVSSMRCKPDASAYLAYYARHTDFEAMQHENPTYVLKAEGAVNLEAALISTLNAQKDWLIE